MALKPLPPEIVKEIEALDQPGLLARRAVIIGKGAPNQLDDTSLQEMVLIHNLLRRRSSGPPAPKKGSKSNPNSMLPPKERLESLL